MLSVTYRWVYILFLVFVFFANPITCLAAKRKKKAKTEVLPVSEVLEMLSHTNGKRYGCVRKTKSVKVYRILSELEQAGVESYKLKAFKKKKKNTRKTKSALEKRLIKECKSRKNEPVTEDGQDGLGFAFLSTPFSGTYPLSNLFDHNLPFQFGDTNGFQLTSTNEKLEGIDGHNGYDWVMSEGTEIYAVAYGKVIFAGQEEAFECPILDNTMVQGIIVVIEHSVKDKLYRSIYRHLSKVHVSEGDTVNEGQLIALSGNTGCSTGAHLHFEVLEQPDNATEQLPASDPFGWRSTEADPWESHKDGVKSYWLWKSGQEPELYKESSLALPDDLAGPVAITKVRYMGELDNLNPNNEFIVIELNDAQVPSGSYDLSGHTLRNELNESISLPQGSLVRSGQALKIYSGLGTNSANEIYLGKDEEFWNNNSGCVQLLYPSGENLYYLTYQAGTCAEVTSSASEGASAPVLPSDYQK